MVVDKQVDVVTINSFDLNSIWAVIVAKVKTSCSQNSVMIPYKIVMGSDDTIVPYNIYLNLYFPGLQRSI